MGRGGRTNKHVYCSRREDPDPGAPRPLRPGWVTGARDGGGRSNPQLRGGHQDLSHLRLTPDNIPKGLRIKQRSRPLHPPGANPPWLRSQTPVGVGGRGHSGDGDLSLEIQCCEETGCIKF